MTIVPPPQPPVPEPFCREAGAGPGAVCRQAHARTVEPRGGRAGERARAAGLALALAGSLGGCASTTVTREGAVPARPACQAAGEALSALVLWGPRWRPDQKEPARREAAAAEGLRDFFATSGCFARVDLRRVPLAAPPTTAQLDGEAAQAAAPVDRVLAITVRELGPVLRLFSSAALVEGGTEVVLEITAYTPGAPASRADFSLRWQHGGPGVVKGVDTLAQDLRAALAAALPATRSTLTP